MPASAPRRGVHAQPFDPDGLPLAALVERGIDRVWIALHGPGGEDGAVQGALEWLGVPYTGSGVLGSAIGMDKLRTKQLAVANEIPTPEFRILAGAQDCQRAADQLGLPLAVKPAPQGSSVGMSRCWISLLARPSLVMVSTICTGLRISSAWSAIARVIAWRIHQVA